MLAVSGLLECESLDEDDDAVDGKAGWSEKTRPT